jgi:hypothetical protein
MYVFWMAATMAFAGQLGDRYPQDASAGAPSPPAAASSEAGAPAGDVAAPAASVTIQLSDAESAGAPAASAPAAAAPAATAPTAAAPAATAPAAAASDATAAAEAERSVVAGATGPKPSELMRTLMKPPAAGQLQGVPLTLGEAVRASNSRQNQTARAKAYWNLSAAAGEYYLAMLEQTQLAALRQMVAAPGPLWDQKLREYDARTEVARSSAQAAQLELQQLVGGTSLPLPADLPHCGRYNTEYEEIFKTQPNLAAKQLDELMPLRYEQLRSQANGVVEAHQWLTQVSQTRDPSTDGAGLLQAYDLLSLRRRAFLATARDYNKEIAAYTELAAPDVVGPDRLVAMMIRTSAAGAAPWERSAVTPASANEEATADAGAGAAGANDAPSAQADAQGLSSPRTFRFRRPLQRLFNREKSIVVKRPLLRRSSHENEGDE